MESLVYILLYPLPQSFSGGVVYTNRKTIIVRVLPFFSYLRRAPDYNQEQLDSSVLPEKKKLRRIKPRSSPTKIVLNTSAIFILLLFKLKFIGFFSFLNFLFFSLSVSKRRCVSRFSGETQQQAEYIPDSGMRVTNLKGRRRRRASSYRLYTEKSKNKKRAE